MSDYLYKNCPLVQRLNCRNNEIYCHDCYCNEDKGEFRYEPLNKDISHPHKKKEKELKSERGKSNNRKGRINEKVIMRKIKKGKENKSSIGYDGIVSNKYKVEIKSRLNGVKRWPTNKEWTKFVVNRLDFFIVDMGERDIRCCMTLDKLNELLELIG